MAASEADIGEQLHEIGAPHCRLVDEVLALAAAVQPPRDRDLAELQLWELTVRVVEQQLDLAPVRRRVTRRPREQDVVRLLRPELGRRQRTRGPEQRVGDIRLPGPVRTDDHGDAPLEANLDRVRERLEAAQLDRAEVHERRTLATSADGSAVHYVIPSLASTSWAAACSAAFFDCPWPTPTCSPSTVAAHVNERSCGGPSTFSTE